jgi:60 kDa SS-A/Ro ribonucleoprotein
MAKYSRILRPNAPKVTATPQSQPIVGKKQVINNAGGFVFAIDQWARLDRWLILGSDAQTYYQKAPQLTKQNVNVVKQCWEDDPIRTAQRIVEISVEGRAPKQSPILFALALGAISPNMQARQLAMNAVQKVCRTASHLFEWMENCRSLGKGYGRGMKRAIARWYSERNTEQVAFQAIKYRQREGFTHKRALEVSHKGAGASIERQALYRWMRGKFEGDTEDLPKFIQAHTAAMSLDKSETKRLCKLIAEHKLPWEAIPTWALTEPKVWNAMIPHLGLTALIRNLGNMTACEAISFNNYKDVVERLTDTQNLHKSRVHPFNILQALAVYKSGHGVMGNKRWSPVVPVIDALDKAFYASFKNVEATGKRIMLALDVSGSMTSPMGGSSLTCREASAAMALVTLAVEPNVTVVGFTAGTSQRGFYGYGSSAISPLTISACQRLDDVCNYISRLGFSGTDCSLPFSHAIDNHLDIDAVVLYTDNETWAGREHPVQALNRYRKISGINTKSVVVGMTSTGFSIADPNDSGMLDIVGFDSAGPSLISGFIGGWNNTKNNLELDNGTME